jgi:hypothetical protein
MDKNRVLTLLAAAKTLAQEYRTLTGKPLGITGEIAEYEAARILGLTLAAAREPGYDAIELVDGSTRRLQIKGRCLLDPKKSGQRIGRIRLDHDCDAVLLVLLDGNFDALEIHEAIWPDVVAALTLPGSRSRNERGALAVSKFKSIATLRWRRDSTEVPLQVAKTPHVDARLSQTKCVGGLD